MIELRNIVRNDKLLFFHTLHKLRSLKLHGADKWTRRWYYYGYRDCFHDLAISALSGEYH